jgi:hypothetical protein
MRFFKKIALALAVAALAAIARPSVAGPTYDLAPGGSNPDPCGYAQWTYVPMFSGWFMSQSSCNNSPCCAPTLFDPSPPGPNDPVMKWLACTPQPTLTGCDYFLSTSINWCRDSYCDFYRDTVGGSYVWKQTFAGLCSDGCNCRDWPEIHLTSAAATARTACR